MTAHVIGPVSDPEKAAIAAKRLSEGATVVVWDEDADALGSALQAFPATPPGRVCSWVGAPDDEGLEALIGEVLDPPVK